jgi:hypothetical protein
MTDKIRNDDSKTRVVRLLGHRDDAGAWQIRDFLKRSVISFAGSSSRPKRIAAAS